jgi:hypothetical protein
MVMQGLMIKRLMEEGCNPDAEQMIGGVPSDAGDRCRSQIQPLSDVSRMWIVKSGLM